MRQTRSPNRPGRFYRSLAGSLASVPDQSRERQMSPHRSNGRSGVGWQAAICCAASHRRLRFGRAPPEFRWNQLGRCFPRTAHWRHSQAFSVLQGTEAQVPQGSPLSWPRTPIAIYRNRADRFCLPLRASGQTGSVGTAGGHPNAATSDKYGCFSWSKPRAMFTAEMPHSA